MSHVARGPKKSVNMTLSEDLVREARTLTGNLSETVEQLLAESTGKAGKGLIPAGTPKKSNVLTRP